MFATVAIPVPPSTTNMSSPATSSSSILDLNHNQFIVPVDARRKSISASSSSFINTYRFNVSISRSFWNISYPSLITFRPISPVMECQDCRVKMEVDVPTSVAYKCYSDHDAIPEWMPFISSPTPNQKLHWRSVEGLPNSGAVRFFPNGPSSCIIELIVSYEVPRLLVPVESALKPFFENLLAQGLDALQHLLRATQLTRT
ncbi:putative xyloglucan 6-xylosyltransferase-like [Capsicum annuum]|nr:putative xyloglucan 6-xylosyltransferase-like [Capsicum annuum]